MMSFCGGLADLCASLEESFKRFREKVAALAIAHIIALSNKIKF